MKIVFAIEKHQTFCMNKTYAYFDLLHIADESPDEESRGVWDAWEMYIENEPTFTGDNFQDNTLPRGNCLYEGNADLSMDEAAPLISDVKLLYDYSEVVV